MIKAVFFDIDDTLFSYTIQGIPPSSMEALRLLKERNILRIIATGRHPNEVCELPLKEMDMDGYVLMNGQICSDHNLVPFYGNPFTGASLEAVVRIFQEKKIPALLCSDKDFYLNTFTDRVARVHAIMDRPAPSIGTYQGEKIYQFTVYTSYEEIEFLKEEIPGCQFLHWNSLMTDIIPLNSGKMPGIRKMLEHIQCNPEEIMAFGDGPNDADMLKFAGIGVAMGNSYPLALKHADFVTKDIDDDGILYALKHLGIL